MDKQIVAHPDNDILISDLKKKEWTIGTSLAVQWLRLQASNAEDSSLIPGQGTKILCAMRQ